MSQVRAECKGFKCKPGEKDCCCRHILYDQPDFANVDSLLQTICTTRGFQVLFLLKFHCELNFIEQYWGRAKSIYWTYAESLREDQLEANTISALESIPLVMMWKFSNRSQRFMDAYLCGLNGQQAAWALRKYRGHRVLPASIMGESKHCVRYIHKSFWWEWVAFGWLTQAVRSTTKLYQLDSEKVAGIVIHQLIS